MTVVFNTLLTANDQPLAGKSIRLVLVAPGFVDDQQAEIVRTAYATTDATGRYEFADVEPNATIDPANTYYLVYEPGLTVPWAIVVPDSGTAQWVKGLLVDPPPAGPLVVSGSVGPKGDTGDTGAAGQGVPVGGTTGQLLAKVDGTDYNTHWSSATAPVASVNGHTGTVVLIASDVGADVSGAAATAQTAAVTAAGTYTDGKITAEVSRANTAYDTAGAATAAQTAAASDATSKVATEATARNTAIAAQHTTDLTLFDAAGAASAAQAAAISAAATDATTKVASEATARTTAIATQHTADVAAFDAAGAASMAQAFAVQRVNHTGTQLLATISDAGTAASHPATDFSGSAAGTAGKPLAANDSTTTNARTPTAHAASHASGGTDAVTLAESQVTGLVSDLAGKQASGSYITALAGDVTASGPGSSAATVTKVNGTALSGLATGLLKNTTGTGVPSIAAAADVPTVAQGSTGPLSATDGTLTNSRTPTAHAASHAFGGSDPLVYDVDALTTGQFSLRRKELTSNGPTAVSGTLMLGYFTADKTETITTLDVATGSVAAGATPTICRMGIYSLDGSGNGTLLVSTANDTTLFAATNTIYSKALSSSFSKVAGTRYCTAVIVVSAATMPNYTGLQMASTNPLNTWVRLAPPISGRLLSQTDLPATFTVGSLVGVQGIVEFYMH